MKKMRNFLFFFGAFLFAATSLSAQPGKYGTGPDSTECRQKLSFYREYVRAGDIISAVPSWRVAMALCPRDVNQLLFSDGQTILKTLLQQPGVPVERRNEMVDSIILLYDIRIENYPQNRVSAMQFKVRDLGTFKPDAKEEQLAALEVLLNETGGETIPEMLVRYMDLIRRLYAEEERTAEDVMDSYSRLMAILDAQEQRQPDNEEIKGDKQMIEDMLIASGVANCENLIALFTPRFEANPDDLDLISKMVSLLTYAECASSDLYLQSVTALNKLAPSYQTAYYLSRMHASKGEYDLAMNYIQEAINHPDIPALDKADYMVQQGTLYFRNLNNSTRAMAVARAAMDVSSEVRGKAYMLMASIWAGQRCGESDIEKRAPFWVAVDYLTKAKAANRALTEEADKLIANYRQYFPLQEEAFMYDLMDGSEYTVICGGLRETTTVRTRK